MKFSHIDYVNGLCTHREFYAQFLTPAVFSLVRQFIGAEKILRSTDEHFNDIPLKTWDLIANSYAHMLKTDYNSLCQRVCLLKEAAQQIRENGSQQNDTI